MSIPTSERLQSIPLTEVRPEERRFISERAKELRELSKLWGIPFEAKGVVTEDTGRMTPFKLGSLQERATREDKQKLQEARAALAQYMDQEGTPTAEDQGLTIQSVTSIAKKEVDDIPEGEFSGKLKVSTTFRPIPESPLTQMLEQHGAPEPVVAHITRRVGVLAGTKHLPFERIAGTISKNQRNEGVNWDNVIGSLAVSVNSTYRKMRGAGPK